MLLCWATMQEMIACLVFGPGYGGRIFVVLGLRLVGVAQCGTSACEVLESIVSNVCVRGRESMCVKEVRREKSDTERED